MFKSMIVIESTNSEIAGKKLIETFLNKEFPNVTFKVREYTIADKTGKPEVMHKHRGRPKGSTTKPKVGPVDTSTVAPKKRGRPRKNPLPVAPVTPAVGTSIPKKRGRPKGSTNKPKVTAPLTVKDLRKEQIIAAVDRIADKSVEECRAETKDILQS